MHSDNPANKKIPKCISVKASHNLSDGLSDCGGGFNNDGLFGRNSLALLIDSIIFLQMPNSRARFVSYY
jgi:hypothetical protein